ncbi:hypothetical protein B296_00034361 [Ensete ventricosum]|uniref:Uncharacterized protein n=1 Tax=Ensete ventricosum TaxID=4639 RepID=A0A426ZKL6_ENSVE|nr:hypothetical protein B296_00034361 [Ensete ventricosum]
MTLPPPLFAGSFVRGDRVHAPSQQDLFGSGSDLVFRIACIRYCFHLRSGSSSSSSSSSSHFEICAMRRLISK